MRQSRLATWTAVSGVLVILPLAALAAAQQQPPPLPKPGPEHQMLKMDAGVWDAVVEMAPGGGAPPTRSKGVETNTLGCGGLCLITDFKGELMPGTAFHGHGTTTWDPAKKKYVGSWTDSMSQGLSIGEYSWDPDTKKLTGTMEGPDMSGQVQKMRAVTEYKGTSRVFMLYGPGAGGTEAPMMTITYTRRK